MRSEEDQGAIQEKVLENNLIPPKLHLLAFIILVLTVMPVKTWESIQSNLNTERKIVTPWTAMAKHAVHIPFPMTVVQRLCMQSPPHSWLSPP